ncbi:hypothetical protein EXIGLDRAFT_433846 [Exidia glandulosa HHB12029]|uniref:Uncharacterized protein n=1 Tax=Exidia glandulosa HHB12029 TaxID=1314781 RepID=A0A165B9L8_EXIGL|nr:hypothetical protein EXIGLDRAFT_433846 [Exidia glandulosa HHB12029]
MHFEVAVAEYGHESLPGARHWALLVVHEPRADGAYVFQLTGSTSTYEVKPPEVVTVSRAQSYLGRITVGSVSPDELPALGAVVRGVQVRRGDRNWHCQHWVCDVLSALHATSFNVVSRTRQQLVDHFSVVTVASHSLSQAHERRHSRQQSLTGISVSDAARPGAPAAFKSVLTRIVRTQ